MKTCFKCGVEKPIDEFYKHPQMGDGHLGKCKDCTKQDMRIDRHTKPRVREYDRRRANLPHRVALRVRVAKEWDGRHPNRARAQMMAGNAVRDGKLVKPERCEGCGLERRLEKHHHDYSRPLLVVWLCKPCHAIADTIRRRMEAADAEVAS
jgi:hypothetical protein